MAGWFAREYASGYYGFFSILDFIGVLTRCSALCPHLRYIYINVAEDSCASFHTSPEESLHNFSGKGGRSFDKVNVIPLVRGPAHDKTNFSPH